MAELTFREAIGRGIAQEMERDPSVYFIGEDVGAAGGVFKTTVGLQERFGDRRVRDTPISEQAIVGLVMGLLTYAYPAARLDLERATDLFRLFREQPTPELARSAQVGLEYAISPNERLQHLIHPWSSYVIVPLFALGNAGIPIDAAFLSRAFTSPITIGILVAYVVGKPWGSRLRVARDRAQPRPAAAAGPAGRAAGGGAIAGIGFTVSILIASLRSTANFQEAKLGVLSAAVCAALLSWLVFA